MTKINDKSHLIDARSGIGRIRINLSLFAGFAALILLSGCNEISKHIVKDSEFSFISLSASLMEWSYIYCGVGIFLWVVSQTGVPETKSNSSWTTSRTNGGPTRTTYRTTTRYTGEIVEGSEQQFAFMFNLWKAGYPVIYFWYSTIIPFALKDFAKNNNFTWLVVYVMLPGALGLTVISIISTMYGIHRDGKTAEEISPWGQFAVCQYTIAFIFYIACFLNAALWIMALSFQWLIAKP